MIEVREIRAEETFPIRKSVLREGMTLTHHMGGDNDIHTFHLGVFSDENLVCVGSFMQASKEQFYGRQYQLRGMATDKSVQGKGFGLLLLKKAEDILIAKKVDILWCNARVRALNFYKKAGFQTVGDTFEVEQVGPHYLMYKKLR